jgi:hypothetical protein
VARIGDVAIASYLPDQAVEVGCHEDLRKFENGRGYARAFRMQTSYARGRSVSIADGIKKRSSGRLTGC